MIPPIRPPSEWADAQHALLAGGLEGAARTPATAWWWTVRPVPIPDGRLGVVVLPFLALRRRRLGPDGAYIALRRDDAGGAELAVSVDPAKLPSSSGSGSAVVVGEYAPNGAVVVEVEGRSVPAIYNPVRPWGALARAARRHEPEG